MIGIQNFIEDYPDISVWYIYLCDSAVEKDVGFSPVGSQFISWSMRFHVLKTKTFSSFTSHSSWCLPKL